MREIELLMILKKPAYMLVMFGITLLLFDIQYYLMANLPGTEDNMCVMGAAFTLGNIIFAAFISIFTGVFGAGLMFLIAQKKGSQKIAIGSLSGVGSLIGTFTLFCTFCTLPVLSLLGLSMSLAFITEYNLIFKILSIAVLSTGLYLLNNQLKNDCKRCAG